MKIHGSCSCGAVEYSADSKHPVPYMRCYCSVCVKTTGGGGFSVNTSATADSLVVKGSENVKVYRATIDRGEGPRQSEHERHFCGQCGSHLWAFHPKWPKMIHPVAGSLDTSLEPPAQRVHIMLGSKLDWVEVEAKPEDGRFESYPDRSIADFHDDHGWTC